MADTKGAHQAAANVFRDLATRYPANEFVAGNVTEIPAKDDDSIVVQVELTRRRGG